MSKMMKILNFLVRELKGKPRIFHEYRKNAFGKYLLVTNIISSGVPMLFGDLLQQEIEYHKNKLAERYDYERLGRMLIVGLGLGPLHHYFYINLNKYLPGRTMGVVFKKIMFDQFFMGPICIAFFFYGIGLMERKNLNEIQGEIKKKFMEVYLMDWCIWPPSQFINFYFVPVKYQVVYINLITVLYDIFLSYVKHREHTENLKEIAKNY